MYPNCLHADRDYFTGRQQTVRFPAPELDVSVAAVVVRNTGDLLLPERQPDTFHHGNYTPEKECYELSPPVTPELARKVQDLERQQALFVTRKVYVTWCFSSICCFFSYDCFVNFHLGLWQTCRRLQGSSGNASDSGQHHGCSEARTRWISTINRDFCFWSDWTRRSTSGPVPHQPHDYSSYGLAEAWHCCDVYQAASNPEVLRFRSCRKTRAGESGESLPRLRSEQEVSGNLTNINADLLLIWIGLWFMLIKLKLGSMVILLALCFPGMKAKPKQKPMLMA